MKAAVQLGITKEKFCKLSKETGGFDNKFNKNRPAYGEDDSFGAFLVNGSHSLVEENDDIVKTIALGTGNN